MKELKIVATIVAKPESLEAVMAPLKRVVDATRKEEGNISYELHRDITNPCKFIMLEVWASQEAIDSHNASAHFGAFIQETDGMLEGCVVDVVELVF